MNTTLQWKMYKAGYFISLFGTVSALLWIGIFKFTPTEAAAIQPLMENSPFTSWMYKVWDVQMVSNMIGVAEIATAAMLLLSVKFSKFRLYAALGMIATFFVTLSFMFTTPNTWKVVDGVLITNFFILKDLMFLGFGLMLVNFPKKDILSNRASDYLKTLIQ